MWPLEGARQQGWEQMTLVGFICASKAISFVMTTLWSEQGEDYLHWVHCDLDQRN